MTDAIHDGADVSTINNVSADADIVISDGSDGNNNEDGETNAVEFSSSHGITDDGRRILRIRFMIPRERYKGSNTNDVPVTSRRKSAWLRSYGERAWAAALEKEYGLVALEPGSWITASTDLTPTEARARDALDEQQRIVDALSSDVDNAARRLEGLKANVKKVRGECSRTSAAYTEVRADADDAEAALKLLRKRMRLESKLLTRSRNAFKSAHGKQDRRRNSTNRKSYIKARMALNEDRLLFPGTVTLDVRSNIVTAHDFDAPNCWPTVKPLQDGGTDTCILWRDDNNKFIRRTSFYGGGIVSRDKYAIDMVVSSFDDSARDGATLESSWDDPFSDDVFGPL